jgi:hypothetical protein
MPFLGEEGTPGGARACSRRRRRRRFLEEEEAGRGPHGSKRRGWWLLLGQSEAKARWGGTPVADHMGRVEKEKEAGPKPFLGLKSNRVKKINFN